MGDFTTKNPAPATTRDPGNALTVGFGTALAMWFVGYVGRLPGVNAPAAMLFLVFVALLLLGGLVAGRTSSRGAWAGLWAGAVAGGINLLILGSVLGGKSGISLAADLAKAAAIWTPASIAISAALGAAGGMLGRRNPSHSPPARPWAFWFALVTMAATLILLPLGGAVTGFEAGLAVPDWPSSFGYNMFLFPLAKMTGGIYFEHSHRLFGSLVGLTTMALAAYVVVTERRNWVRGLVAAAFVMVVVQGLMGAARVTQTNLTLAVIHGVFGQVFFATLAALAVFLSDTWRRVNAAPSASAGFDRTLALASLAVLLAQLIAGALYRHFQWGLHLHLTLAVIVLLLVGGLAMRLWSADESQPIVSRLGAALLWILIAQLLLGGMSLIAVWNETPGQPPQTLQVLVTTAHQTTGAVLLACATAAMLWQRRLFSPIVSPAASIPSAVPPGPSPRTQP